MKNQTPKLYEGMYILSAQLSEDAKAKAFEKIKVGITEKQGKILKVHDQGKRKLAYAIGSHNDGHYYLMYFEIPPSVMEDLWGEYRLNEDLIRFMTIRTDKVLEKIEFKQLVTEQ